MKKFVCWAIVLVMVCVSMCGCRNNNKINSIREHNSKDDYIKFDDMEWGEEKTKVEEKIKDILVNMNEEYIEISKATSNIQEYTIIDLKDKEKSIGKFAGWDINRININYIKIDGISYVYGYCLWLNSKDNTAKEIEMDIRDKIDNKYREANREDKIGYTWMDNNGNKIWINKYDDGIVTIDYDCMDIVNYIKKVNTEELNKNNEDIKGL